ncbi:MAG TPA: hypothetical protein VFC86_14275 [Planctomycetota bacterium]|nr:hypothetical protein [Planctomycetota bacterium]
MKLAAVALLLAGMAFAQEEKEKIYTNSYKGKAPPELEVEGKNWLNAKKPVKLGDLKGRVVWLEFSFLN